MSELFLILKEQNDLAHTKQTELWALELLYFTNTLWADLSFSVPIVCELMWDYIDLMTHIPAWG